MDKPPKKTNPWVAHVRSFALKNGITYGCALSDTRCKETYKKAPEKAPEKQKPKGKNDNKAPEKTPEKPPEKAPEKVSYLIKNKLEKNDKNEDLSITEYKGDKIKGSLKIKLKYFINDDSTLLKPLRKRIHILLEPTNRINRESDLFFTNSINKSDILKDIKKYYDINLIKKYDIVPFDKLDIEEVFGGEGITASVSETWNMPKISIGARRR